MDRAKGAQMINPKYQPSENAIRQRIYREAHPEIKDRYKDARARGVKPVSLEYPGGAYPDHMSKTEFNRWRPGDFPEGTRVWINGQEVGMQMELKLEETK
jgi:hypothetical protein